MKIIAGLGNPGFRYRNTRHNAGFMVMRLLEKRHRLKIKKKGYAGVYGVGRVKGEEVLFFEPLTYMNLSGNALSSVCSSKQVKGEELLVITDDISLPLGEIRLREKGSAGGHNGLRSVISCMGDRFCRLRLGIGPSHIVEDMSAFVLGPFSRGEKTLLKEELEKAADCVEIWIAEGAKEAMNSFN